MDGRRDGSGRGGDGGGRAGGRDGAGVRRPWWWWVNPWLYAVRREGAYLAAMDLVRRHEEGPAHRLIDRLRDERDAAVGALVDVGRACLLEEYRVVELPGRLLPFVVVHTTSGVPMKWFETRPFAVADCARRNGKAPPLPGGGA